MLFGVVKTFLEPKISLLLVKNILSIFDLDELRQIVFRKAVRVDASPLVDVMDGGVICLTRD